MPAKKKKIKGRVTYLQLEGGIWGIVDDKGNEWLPISLPAELMKNGLKIKAEIRISDDFLSGGMWGVPVELLKHEVID
jgi:hypothetical protein